MTLVGIDVHVGRGVPEVAVIAAAARHFAIPLAAVLPHDAPGALDAVLTGRWAWLRRTDPAARFPLKLDVEFRSPLDWVAALAGLAADLGVEIACPDETEPTAQGWLVFSPAGDCRKVALHDEDLGAADPGDAPPAARAPCERP